MISVGRTFIDRKARTIERNARVAAFRGAKSGRRYAKYDLLCHLLLAGPQTRMQLFERLYGDREDGGPTDLNTIFTYFTMLNEVLRTLGLKLQRSDGYPRRYWIEG